MSEKTHVSSTVWYLILYCTVVAEMYFTHIYCNWLYMNSRTDSCGNCIWYIVTLGYIGGSIRVNFLESTVEYNDRIWQFWYWSMYSTVFVRQKMKLHPARTANMLFITCACPLQNRYVLYSVLGRYDKLAIRLCIHFVTWEYPLLYVQLNW